MRSNLPRILSRLESNLGDSGTTVSISWEVYPAGVTVDPVTGAQNLAAGSVTIQTMTVKAFLHFPQPVGNAVVRQFQEIEAGDCIADFCQDVPLDGKPGLKFMFLDHAGNPIDGVVWEIKPISERLAKNWDVIVAGHRLLRTVLLRKAT